MKENEENKENTTAKQVEYSKEHHERKFKEKLDEYLKKKKDNSETITHEEYLKLISEVKEARSRKALNQPLKSKDYRRLAKYGTVQINDSDYLIAHQKDNSADYKLYAYAEQLFRILHESHVTTGHKRLKGMQEQLSKTYANITRDITQMFLTCCNTCQHKKKKKGRGLVVKPIRSSHFNSRCQVDLIDLQSEADGEYKFILNYQCHLTKFCILRPLKSKTAEAVAHELLDIFCLFGAPCYLQSDNGREFVNKIIEELCSKWEHLKIIHGKPRHSQSQGSVERANQCVQDILHCWLKDNNTKSWATGLKYVQMMKNKSFHRGINQSPYEALFGTPLRCGLKDSNLPQEVVDSITNAEDLERALEHLDSDTEVYYPEMPSFTAETSVSAENTAETSNNAEVSAPLTSFNAENSPETVNNPLYQSYSIILSDENEQSTQHKDLVQNVPGPSFCTENNAIPNHVATVSSLKNFKFHNTLQDLNSPGQSTSVTIIEFQCVVCDNNIESSSIPSNLTCDLCNRKEKIDNNRKSAKRGLDSQADKMLQISNKKFKPAMPGQNILIKIPDVDRSRLSSRNLLAVVTNYNESTNLYEVATKDGKLNKLYCRNEFQFSDTNDLSLHDVPTNKTTTLRTAASVQCGSKQGFTHCNCVKGCQSKSCSCKKNNLLCNSKCHPKSKCNNK